MKHLAFCVLLALPLASVAQVKCTMPNGVVATFNLSDKCPTGAIKQEKGNPDEVIQPTFKGEYREPTPLPPRSQPAPRVAPPPKKERDIVEEAYGICKLLKMSGATTCDVNVNIFSASFIDATIPTTPKDARMTCLLVANQTRKPGSPFVGRGWQLKIFSPYGQNRPIATCTL